MHLVTRQQVAQLQQLVWSRHRQRAARGRGEYDPRLAVRVGADGLEQLERVHAGGGGGGQRLQVAARLRQPLHGLPLALQQLAGDELQLLRLQRVLGERW